MAAAAAEKPVTFSRDASTHCVDCWCRSPSVLAFEKNKNQSPKEWSSWALTCLHCESLCCSWSCLHYRGLCCIWMCLQYATEPCVAQGRVYNTKACAAPRRVYTTEARAAPSLVYTAEACPSSGGVYIVEALAQLAASGTLQKPLLHMDVSTPQGAGAAPGLVCTKMGCAAPGGFYTTWAWAVSGRVYTSVACAELHFKGLSAFRQFFKHSTSCKPNSSAHQCKK